MNITVCSAISQHLVNKREITLNYLVDVVLISAYS